MYTCLRAPSPPALKQLSSLSLNSSTPFRFLFLFCRLYNQRIQTSLLLAIFSFCASFFFICNSLPSHSNRPHIFTAHSRHSSHPFLSFLLCPTCPANSANLSTAGYVFLCVLVFAVVLIVLFRPLFWRLVTYVEAMHSPAMNNGLFCLTLILVFLCAWTTALLGLGERSEHVSSAWCVFSMR